MTTSQKPPVVLFGYDSSPFTQKVRLALRMRQIEYTFVLVPSMMPRPILLDNFNLAYRKIPVLAIGKELYIDTSLILEILHSHPCFPPTSANPPLHRTAQIRALSRLLASHFTDRPFFRLTTGLIPPVVWQTDFGTDRAGLIGHTLDASKLGRKVPRNLAGMDAVLSVLEAGFSTDSTNTTNASQWLLPTPQPSMADLALFYQLDWGRKISRGEGIADLTGGRTRDFSDLTHVSAADAPVRQGLDTIFTRARYPLLTSWSERFQTFIDDLSETERRVERGDDAGVRDVMNLLNTCRSEDVEKTMIPSPVARHEAIDNTVGVSIGRRVRVAPDDTGRDDPTTGTVVALSSEEVVITPDERSDGQTGAGVRGIRLHFPRVGFVVLPVESEATTKKQRAKL